MRSVGKKRIVITGIGIISPIGIGSDAYWQGLAQAKRGFRPVSLFDASDLKVKIAGEISDFNAKEILGKKGLVDFDRATTLLLSSAKFALEDSCLEITPDNTYDTGISIGTTFGSLNSLSEFDQQSLDEGPNFVNASRFPNTVINSPASRLAIRYSVKGINSTLSTGFCSALDALEYSICCISSGRAKRMICGSVEEMCVQTFLGFYRLGYLSGLKNNSKALSCPFDKRRDGIIFSEAAAVFILEELNDALERKAKVYAEILGAGSNFDPFRLHKFNPLGTGLIEAMRLSLNSAGIAPQNIDCIYANANSTQDADLAETKAIKDVFGDLAYKIPVSAVKSMTGESFSASGGLALAAAIGSLEQDFIAPTANLETRDPRCDLDYVPNVSRQQKVNKIMVNSFGPNGANSVLVIGRAG